MNKQQAKRLAHEAVAALVSVNLETDDGDLFVAVADELEPADRERFEKACAEIVAYHYRRAES